MRRPHNAAPLGNGTEVGFKTLFFYLLGSRESILKAHACSQAVKLGFLRNGQLPDPRREALTAMEELIDRREEELTEQENQNKANERRRPPALWLRINLHAQLLQLFDLPLAGVRKRVAFEVDAKERGEALRAFEILLAHLH